MHCFSAIWGQEAGCFREVAAEHSDDLRSTGSTVVGLFVVRCASVYKLLLQ